MTFDDDDTPQPPPPTPPKNTARKILGALIMVASTLVMLATGGCALVLGAMSVSGGEYSPKSQDIPDILTFLGLPFLIGAFLFWFGLRLTQK
jgi:hypothetical protein